MRHDFRPQSPGFRLIVALWTGLALGGLSALALSEGNPYAAISGRNVFALKPPTPTTPATVTTPTVPPNIELQGFTTILGRAQVLLKIKLPPKPPEPAKDRSLVMDVGDSEGGVEVLEMDPHAGIVKLRNQGNPVSLNLKDNGSKPTAGPALPPPALPAAASGIPLPAAAPAPASSVSTMGGSGLPSRSIRNNNPAPQTGMAGVGGIGRAGGAAQPQQRDLTPEEGAALLEVNRKANEGRPVPLPFPPSRVNPDN